MVKRGIESNYFEVRFNCVICLSPKRNMVFGLCQHKVCSDCLYHSNGYIRLRKCPICQLLNSFPVFRPTIPEDNISMMKQLGVVTCPNKCATSVWHWDLYDHLIQCPNRNKETQRQPKKKKHNHSSKHKCRCSEKGSCLPLTLRTGLRRSKRACSRAASEALSNLLTPRQQNTSSTG